MSPSPRTLAALAIPMASLVSITACGSTLAASGTAPAASSSAIPVALAADATPSPGAATSATGPGTVTITMTSPVSESAVIHSAVTCTQTSKRYVVRAPGFLMSGYRHAWAVRIPDYHGPGSYRDAAVAYSVAGPLGRGRGWVKSGNHFPVTITDAGGTLTVHLTGAKGRVLNETVSWTCP